MSNPREPFIVIDDLSGGYRSNASPLTLGPTDCAAAENVEWVNSRMPKKRQGGASQSLAAWSPASCNIISLVTHTPAVGIAAKELWAFTNKATTEIGRLAGGTSWAAVVPAPDDGPNGTLQFTESIYGASFNNKLFLAFYNTADRMHVWDGTTLRRTGMAATAAPTVANTGAGGYAATIRYYKTMYFVLSGAVILRRAELSASVSFTPSGAGTHARVTKPAAPGEGETHWALFGSADNVNFYLITTIVVGTSTYDDSADPATYSAGVLAPDADEFLNMMPAKYVTALDNRVFLANSWDNTAHASRVWFTPVLGETNEGDDERIPADHYVDVDPTAHGEIVGLALYLGSVIVFKATAMYKLVQTGVEAAPYLPQQVSDTLGGYRQNAIVSGDDAQGNPCLYWMTRHGVYQWSPAGFAMLSESIQNVWDTLIFDGYVHVEYWPERRQLWCFVNRNASGEGPNAVLVYHVTLGAWSLYTNGVSATTGIGRSYGAALFAETPGASMSIRQVPWVALHSASFAPTILKANASGQDNGVSFQAFVKTGARAVAGPMTNGGVTEAQVHASALASQTLRLSLIRDYGLETRTFDVVLTAEGSETRVVRKFEDATLTSAAVVQAQIGDSAAVNSGAWELDAVILRVRAEEVR